MSLSSDEKKQMIANRREGPERRKYGAELDLKLAKAAKDEAAIKEAQGRVDQATAELDALNAAEAQASAKS